MRTHVSSELKSAVGKSVTLAGWVHDVRLLGTINFVILRDSAGTVQLVVKKDAPPDVVNVVSSLHQEDVVEVSGTVVESKEAKSGIEVIPSSLVVLAKAQTPLPLDPRWITPAHLDTRLEWRSLDLRRRENRALFAVQSSLQRAMESFLVKAGFVRAWTPSVLGGVSEGGADVFKIDFFGKPAFLRQDPQLHRQLLIAGGFERVYDLGPSWRAEPSDQPTHLAEYRTLAPELAFIKDERDVMKLEQNMCVAGIKHIVKECAAELEVLGKQIQVPKAPFPELRFPKVYDILKELGKTLPRGSDLDKESEKLLAGWVREKKKHDFFFLNRFPSAVKPFYVMRVDDEPAFARSVDLVYKGLEMSSGGQREHRHEKIVAQIGEKGLSAPSLSWFTDVFKYGVPPHGGFSIGIERLTMKLLDMTNIKEAVLFPRYVTRLSP